jgi:hypothetical protein
LCRHRPASEALARRGSRRGGVELFSRRIANEPDAFVALLGELDGESKIALEATYSWDCRWHEWRAVSRSRLDTDGDAGGGGDRVGEVARRAG